MAWPSTASRRRDLITGSAVVLVGVIYYIATFSIELTNNVITPRTFPAIVGLALIVLGAVLIVQSLYRGKNSAPAEEVSATAGTDVRSGAGDFASAGGAEDSTGVVADSAGAGEGPAGIVLEAEEEPKAKKVVLQFVLFFAYLALVIPVGFLLGTAGFLMALTSIYAPDRWIRNLIYSVLFSVIVYVAFVYGLAVYLPVGILG